MDTVTVVIPHIPVRPNALARAVKSVATQTSRPDAVHIEMDIHRTGSAATRNRALAAVRTRWVAFLDDDDLFEPNHLATLLDRVSLDANVDVIYTGCTVIGPDGREVPLREEWGRFGQAFDADLLRQKSYLPVTSLVRADLARRALFGPPAGTDSDYDDWGFYVRLLDLGARFEHIPVRTWVWNHHGRNTSGRPDRW